MLAQNGWWPGVVETVIAVLIAIGLFTRAAHLPEERQSGQLGRVGSRSSRMGVGYDEATTQDAVLPEPSCYELTTPGLPESLELDVKAQLEHDVRPEVVDMTCDTDVEVTCDPEADCTAVYGDERLVIYVIREGCDTPWPGRLQTCKYRTQPKNRFLSQKLLNHHFALFSTKERERGALARCDTIPGGADLIPPEPAGAAISERFTTTYHCYTRRPGSITYTYNVLAEPDDSFTFEEQQD